MFGLSPDFYNNEYFKYQKGERSKAGIISTHESEAGGHNEEAEEVEGELGPALYPAQCAVLRLR